IPLALDLISTFVVGSILPVATTDRTIVPFSATTSLLESTSADAPPSFVNPATIARAITTRTAPMYQRFRERFCPAGIREVLRHLKTRSSTSQRKVKIPQHVDFAECDCWCG